MAFYSVIHITNIAYWVGVSYCAIDTLLIKVAADQRFYYLVRELGNLAGSEKKCDK